ncbi:MAG: transglutaminase N-terminal domain-containing protein [Beijerinckiaceae bacterium]
MRIHIRHEIAQVFEPPAPFMNAVLRLTPRSHESQHVARWRVEIDGDSRIRAFDDGFGNCMHTLSMAGRTESLRILAEGVVDTFDAAGIVRATVERFPPELFLRETSLTQPCERLRAIAAGAEGANRIERLHALLLRIGVDDDAGGPAQAQMQTQAQKPAEGDAAGNRASGKAKTLAHDFIVCARLIGAPARFVSGYYLDLKADSGGAHFWAEAHVDGVGWIGFDPANAICPHESHVRMAIGLDALDAACVRAAPAPLSVTEIVDVRRES